jgi:hypothetical protein
MLNVIGFSLMAISNMDLSQRNILIKNELNDTPEISIKKERTGTLRLLYVIYSSVFVIYGNFNLLLIPLAFNVEWAYYMFILVLIVVFKSLIGIVKKVHQRNVYMGKNSIMWK